MQINTEKNQKEVKTHGDFGFPVQLSTESITQYEGGEFLWHWHTEIELTWVMYGQMEYHVNEQRYILKEGDGLFTNSGALHSGNTIRGQECRYLSLTFHPRFLYGYEGSLLKSEYVDVITLSPSNASLKLESSVQWQHEIIDCLVNIYKLSKAPDSCFGLDVHTMLWQAWRQLYRHFSSAPDNSSCNPMPVERLRQILHYINLHYQEPLTLNDIASHVNICRSECCRFFKKHMDMTLFEYLTAYRIKQSLPLLRDGQSITKIAAATGFSNPCYYGKLFKRYMNCSPRQYSQASILTPR